MMRCSNFKPLVEQTQPAINSSVSCVGVRGYSGDHDWSLDEVMKLVREESKVLGQTVAWEG